ncbi:MAG: hypothetical protein AB7N76_20920 [Planctomycetota bacterium]
MATTALAFPARAQDSPPPGEPRLERVLFNGQPTTVVAPGYAIEVQGQDLFEPPPVKPGGRPSPDRLAPVRVTLGGKAALVLEATRTQLFLLVPQGLRPGKAKLELRIAGRGAASLAIEVGPPPVGGDGGDPPPSVPFELTRFTLQPTASGPLFRVEGKCPDLPDGMRVQVSLGFEGQGVQGTAVAVQGGAFAHTFGPYREALPVGIYEAEALFTLNKQSRAAAVPLVQELRRRPRGAELLEAYKRLRRVAHLPVGGTGEGGQLTPEDRAPQQLRVQERAKTITEGVTALVTELERRYAVAGRAFFKAQGQARYDAAAYRAWLIKERFAQDDAAAQRLEAERAGVTASGHLEPDAWEREVVKPLVERLDALAAPSGERLLCPPDPRAQRYEEELLGQALALLQRWTRALYGRAKLTPPAALDAAQRVQPAATRATRGELEATRKLLLRQVGLPPS